MVKVRVTSGNDSGIKIGKDTIKQASLPTLIGKKIIVKCGSTGKKVARNSFPGFFSLLAAKYGAEADIDVMSTKEEFS